MLTDLGFTDTLEKFADGQPRLRRRSQPLEPVRGGAQRAHLLLADHRRLVLLPGAPAADRVAWLLYPGLIMFSIVATANHFWLDAILGALLAGWRSASPG